MVGDPKHLYDLAKIEADVRITCGACGYEEDWARETLADHLRRIGGSQVWSEITRHMRCRRMDCRSGTLTALPVSFSRRPANMPRRIGELDARLIGAAMSVPGAAVARSGVEPVATVEVSLALLVVYRYTREKHAVAEFWRRAGLTLRGVDASLTEPMNAIRVRLVERGWLPPEHPLRRDQSWPWRSPAPRGWLMESSGRYGHEGDVVVEADETCDGWAMCNRYRMTASQAELAARYGVTAPYPPDEDYPAPELFPKRRAMVVHRVDGMRRFSAMAWGFPMQVRSPSGKTTEKPATNVRNLTSPFWRSALKEPARRCLVPVTTFSEYGPGPTGAKLLHWFDVPSRPIFSFAGIWRPMDQGGVFAFLTCEPNSLVAPIHSKAMPVILDDEGEDRWLRGELDDLVAPFPSQLMIVTMAEPKPKGTPEEAFTTGGDAVSDDKENKRA